MLVKNAIGFMQGRLTEKGGFFPQAFPEGNWTKELYLAERLGFNCVEWMFNERGWKRNPIILDIDKINMVCRETQIRLSGICANYFMRRSIYDRKEKENNLYILNRLLFSAEMTGCGNIIIPMFDASEMQLADSSVYDLVNELPVNEVNILFESNERLADLSEWLSGFHRTRVGICYDIGNAAGMGYDSAKELDSYGDIVKEVHLKDKKVGRTTVMLGEGDADLNACFRTLGKHSYEGCYILESYYHDAVRDTCKNLDYIKGILK